MSSEPINLGEESGVKARAAQLRTDRALKTADLQWIMGTEQGRRIVFWILSDLCQINTNPFATNALIMAHRSGELNVGQRLLAEITTREVFDLYVQMLKEGAKNE